MIASMPLLDFIDIYCERTAAGLLNEPLNTLSNAAFFLAAWFLLKLYRAAGRPDEETATLIGLITIVGAGSLAFHMFANQLSMIADVVPIMVFVFYYLWVALRRLLGIARLTTAFCLLAFLDVAMTVAEIPDPWRFNGSVAYFPCLAALLLIVLALRKRGHPAASDILKAGGIFAVSLTFRSVDMAACGGLPIGTHFLWHLLNGAVLYLLVRAIIRHPK